MTTITAYNSVEIADRINQAFADDETTTVNGLTMKSRWGSPVARSWGNGSISITVPARTVKNKCADQFFKVGTDIEIIVPSEEAEAEAEAAFMRRYPGVL